MDEIDIPFYMEQLLSALAGRARPPVPREPFELLFEQKQHSLLVQRIKETMELDLAINLTVSDKASTSEKPMWLDVPGPIPPLGSPALQNTEVRLNMTKATLETFSFEWFVADVARELARIVLLALKHPLRDDEKAIDLTAMILGFRDFIANAETSSNNETRRALTAAAGLFMPVVRIIAPIPAYSETVVRVGSLSRGEAQWARHYLDNPPKPTAPQLRRFSIVGIAIFSILGALTIAVLLVAVGHFPLLKNALSSVLKK